MIGREIIVNTITIVVAVVVSLIIAEGILRVMGDTDGLDTVLDYRDSWREGGLGPGGYLQENFKGEMQDGFGGTVYWQNNSQGFRNSKEFQVPPPKDTFRVLSMGDSFTGGYRVGQESTFSFLLEKDLSSKNPGLNVEVMVSVIEDPLTGLYFLASQGVSYLPDLVILGITLGNDLAQAYWNMDGRFRIIDDEPYVEEIVDWEASKKRRAEIEAQVIPKECLSSRTANSNLNSKGPRWSAIEGTGDRRNVKLMSLISSLKHQSNPEAPQTVISNWEEYDAPRLFDSNGLGFFLRSPTESIESAYEKLFRTIETLHKVTRSASMDLLVVIFPQRFQVQDQDWGKTLEIYGLRQECFDVEIPNRRILEFCEKNQIRCLDPTRQMRRSYEKEQRSFYLPRHDMHWNALGHAAVADTLRNVVKPN